MTESVNPLLNASGLIDYASVRPEHVAPAVETLSKNLEETLARVTAPETPATWEAVAEPLEKATLAFTSSATCRASSTRLRCETPTMPRFPPSRSSSSICLRTRRSSPSTRQ